MQTISEQDEALRCKLRAWLKTIPIGGAPTRTFDEAPFFEFARRQKLHHLDAEQIYQHFVAHLCAVAELAMSF